MAKKIIGLLFLFLILSFFVTHQDLLKKTSSPEKINWQAFWIRKSGPVERKNFYYFARKKFSLKSLPTEANLFISCQSRCEIYLNGKFLQKIGLYNNPPHQYFEYFEVKDFLQKGENIIAVLGYNEGIDTFFGPKKKDGLLVQLEIKSHWQKKIIKSDSSWKMAEAQAWDRNSERIWAPSAGFQEIFNIAQFPQNWAKVDFQDEAWERAEIIGSPPQKPWGKLIQRPIPYLQEKILPLEFFQKGNFIADDKADVKNPAEFINSGKKEIIYPAEIEKITFQNNQFVSFKLPKQIVGGVKICFAKGGQGTIDIGYAETLNKNGFPDTGRMIFQGDRLLNSQNGSCWQNFSPRSFKYLILLFRNFSQEVQLSSVEGVSTEYPVIEIKEKDFGDKILNQIYQVGIDTLKIDMQETYMDCPIRERSQYIGDARVEALVAYQVFGETELTKKALQEFAWSQDEEGYLSANYPTGNQVNIPTYVLQWVNMLWEYYQNSQDKETLKNLYPTLIELMDYFAEHEDQTGFLISQKDWWLFIDHGNPVADQNYSLILQASYYGSLIDAQKIAQVLNDKKRIEKFDQKSQKLKKTFNNHFWVKEKNLFDDCRNEDGFCQHFSLQGNYWALYWEVVDESKKNILLENLLKNKYHLEESKTPFFNGFIAEVLFKNAKKKEAIELIKNYWGGMIKAGATTWWESFNLQTGWTEAHMGESMAHAWGSLPTYLLRKYLSSD